MKEELELLKLWFDTIRESALSRRNANGVLVSPSRMLLDISVKAKDASEYIDILLKEHDTQNF